jgi:adenosine kinase
MAYAAQLSFHALPAPRPDLAVISPNDPAAMQQYIRECRELGIPYLYDPSQQLVRMAGPELREGIEGAFALFVNDYESGLVEKMTGLDVAGILKYVRLLVITRGEQGSTIYADGQEYHVPVVPPTRIVDPTGVGDAFRGGFLAGFSRGWDWQLCGQMGALAATYCLEQKGTQAHEYTPAEFVARFRLHFDDQGRLDALLN